GIQNHNYSFFITINTSDKSLKILFFPTFRSAYSKLYFIMNSRRDFLQKLTTSAIVLPFLPPYGSSEQLSFYDQLYEGPVLRVAIMGLGSYGTRVAEAMQTCKRAKLVGVISGTPAKIRDWQSKYDIPEKNCYNYENYDSVKD